MKGAISMDAPKPYFERIPVETVKRIAQKVPAEKEQGGDDNASFEPAAAEADHQPASGFALHNGILKSGFLKRNRP
jgi:hypothetical protein